MLSVPIHSKSWKRCGRTNSRLLPYRHLCRGRTSLSRTGSLGRREDHIVLLHVFLFVQREEHHGKLLVAFFADPRTIPLWSFGSLYLPGTGKERGVRAGAAIFRKSSNLSSQLFTFQKGYRFCSERALWIQHASLFCSFEHENDAKERLLHLRFCRAPHVAIEVLVLKMRGDHKIVSRALSDFVSSEKRRTPC
jgi:hypothetical protein